MKHTSKPNDAATSFGFLLSDAAAFEDRAILVQLFLNGERDSDSLAEFENLVDSAGVNRLVTLTTARQTPHAKYFIGSGKAQEITDAVREFDANVIIFNHSLTPAQTRNLSALCQCRVLDRHGLILAIFAQRARSFEGKLQVELAQLRHLASRLIRQNAGFDQQKGAIGLRGPGETQLETDRRLIKVRIAQLQQRLAKVDKQRHQNRKTRQKSDVATVSLVGYTNAGKSTLFNTLTNAEVYAADQLFATLDPTLRQLPIPYLGRTVLADTVGFIRDLPPDLISAFKSTLQESADADLLLHVIDFSDENNIFHQEVVENILAEIGADRVPTLLVYNKIDQCYEAPRLIFDDEQRPLAVYLSAHHAQGIDLLREAIRLRLTQQETHKSLILTSAQGHLAERLREYTLQHAYDEFGDLHLQIRLPQSQWQKWLKRYPDLAESETLAALYAQTMETK